MHERGAGILLHPTSLPSPYGIGDLGPAAYRYVDFLAAAGQRYWQVLPLNPTSAAYGNSPYSSSSAFAGNTLLVSPELLRDDGLLSAAALAAPPRFPPHRCDYAAAIPYKEALLEEACARFEASGKLSDGLDEFRAAQASWLEDFCLFVVIKRRLQGAPWSGWPVELRDRRPEALRAIREACAAELRREEYLQYLFARQWRSLKAYCEARGVRVIGDLSIYVNFDSADVWAHPTLFKLHADKTPECVSGVPPDYFSPTGQLWGNPVYRWERLQETGFGWWIDRVGHQAELFDALRIDHFRGLVAYWEVPATEATALRGRWVPAPTDAFFAALHTRFPGLRVLAEDLGLITPDVRTVLERLGFPGMRVLLFAFSEEAPRHPYLPHMYVQNSVIYTGTHDNNTARGWFEREARPEDRARVARYLGRAVTAEELPWALIRLAMLSVGNTVILPMQDVLGLGEEARMNRPGIGEGNWGWRATADQLTPTLEARLRELTELSGRAP